MSGYLADTSVFVAAEQRIWTQDEDFDVLAELAPALRVERLG